MRIQTPTSPRPPVAQHTTGVQDAPASGVAPADTFARGPAPEDGPDPRRPSLVDVLRPASRLLQLRAVTDTPRVTADEVRALEQRLKPGDVVLVTDTSFPMLELGTYALLGSSWTHAMMYEGEGRLIEASVAGVGGEGVVRTRLEDRIGQQLLFEVVRPPYASDDDARRAVDFCAARVGLPYDYTFALDGDRAYYCTALLYHALQACRSPIDVPLTTVAGRQGVGLDSFKAVAGAEVVYSDQSDFWKNMASHGKELLAAGTLSAVAAAAAGSRHAPSAVAAALAFTALAAHAWVRRTQPHPLAAAAPLAPAPSEHGLEDSVERVLDLRRRRGSPVRWSELADFTETTTDSRFRLFLDRDYHASALVPAIMQARDSIHLAMLSFEPGLIGDSVADALIAKKRENPGMAIRVILDAKGSTERTAPWGLLSHVKRLRAAGVDVRVNNTLADGLEHRKVLVVDGRKAFMGGSCLSDPYYARPEYLAAYQRALEGGPAEVEAFVRARYGEEGLRAMSRPFIRDGQRDPAWQPPRPIGAPEMEDPEYHDFGLEVTGAAVAQMQAGFLQSWLYHGGDLDPQRSEREVRARYFPAAEASGTGGVPSKIVHGIPGRDCMRQTLERVVDSATTTLDVEFAYVLIPEFVAALERAARRGVRIRLVVPGEDGTDIRATWRAFRGMIGDLVKRGGIDVYETHRYTHVKLMVADGRYVFASTGNPEWNSWNRAFDETALIDDPVLAADVERRVFARDCTPERALRVSPRDLTDAPRLRTLAFGANRTAFEAAHAVLPSAVAASLVSPPPPSALRSHPVLGLCEARGADVA